MPEGAGRWYRQRSQHNRHQRTGRQLDYAGWRLSLPDLRECREAGGLRDAPGRLARGVHQRQDPLQQPAGLGRILRRLDGGAIPRPRRPRRKDCDGVMTDSFVSRGFRGRGHRDAAARRLPPGQHETRDFPVLSAGPTPHTSLTTWDFAVRGRDGPEARWTWEEFQALPHEAITVDIH